MAGGGGLREAERSGATQCGPAGPMAARRSSAAEVDAPVALVDDPVPKAALLVTTLLVGALVLCGVGGLEAWPLSGWRLFSSVRMSEHSGWALATVVDGKESPLPFDQLGPALRKAPHVLRSSAHLGPSERNRLCEALARAVRHEGLLVDEIHIYRTAHRSSLDGRPPSSSHESFQRCALPS